MIERPAARYGHQRLTRPSRRRLVIVVFVLVVAAAVALAVVAYQRLGTSEVKGELGGYQLIDADTVQVTISVTREDPSRPVVCIIRARSLDGAEIGRREVLVAPSAQTTVQVIRGGEGHPARRRRRRLRLRNRRAELPRRTLTTFDSRVRRATSRTTPNSQFVKTGCSGGARMDHVHGSEWSRVLLL